MYHESDESVVEKWIENSYWQYFCGEQFCQQAFPCHPTSLVKWRKRVGVDGIERLLKQILKASVQCSALKLNELKCVTVDTTVQEKAIAFPTDARLYDKARKAIEKLLELMLSNSDKATFVWANNRLFNNRVMRLLVNPNAPRNPVVRQNNMGLVRSGS